MLLEQPTASITQQRRESPGSLFYTIGALILAVYVALATGEAAAAIPWCDEAWLSNPALTFLRKGYFGTPVLTSFGWGPPENLLHIEWRTYWIMPLHMLAQTAWYRLFGFSLMSLRTLSVFFGAILVAALGYLAYKLTRTPRIALLAMAIVGTDYFMLSRAADGRMDMMAAAFEILALGVYAAGREKHFSRAVLLSGFLAALAAFTHPVSGFFALSGVVVYALCCDRPRIRMRHLALFLAPLALMGLCWGVYAVQDLPAFFAQLSGNSQGRWEGVSSPYWSVYRELRFKYFQAFGLNSFDHISLQDLRLIPLAFYVAATLTLGFVKPLRMQPGVRPLLWIVAFFVLGGMAFDGAKRWYYLTYVVPLFALALAIWLDWLLRRQARVRYFTLTAITLLLVIQIGGTLFRIHKNDYRNSFQKAASFVRSHDPEHALIYGSGELGFDLGFPDYLVDDLSFGYYTGRKAKLIFIPNVYWGMWIDNMLPRAPVIAGFEKLTLARDYKLAYSSPDYRIYERKQ
jgi:4-amino-4-deoxy-L-arabinose transferase-like glycosyltransferase